MDQKQVTFDRVRDLAVQYRRAGRSIAFTNGCFDILHAGHVSYLAEAKEMADVLIVGLNSDGSVRQIKGEKRPVICQAQRSRVISALACVDHVVLFDQKDPEKLIRLIVPDVLVKGADWPESEIVGAAFVRENGGRVARISLEPEISTTRIIERIVGRYGTR